MSYLESRQCYFYAKGSNIETFALYVLELWDLLPRLDNLVSRKSYLRELQPFFQAWKRVTTRLLKTDRKWMLLLNNCSKTVSGHFFAICIFIFHKTEAHAVILRCTTGLNLNWFKSYGLRCSKMQSFPFLIFNDFVKKNTNVFFLHFWVLCHNFCTN